MSSFEQLLIAEIPRLRSRAIGLTRSYDRADDLVQDTLLRAWKSQSSYSADTNLRAWLLTILRNRFLTGARTAGRFVEDPEGEHTESLVAADDTHAALEAREGFAQLDRMDRRTVTALLRAAEGQSMEEIAAAEGIAVGTAKSRISRGRSVLAELVG